MLNILSALITLMPVDLRVHIVPVGYDSNRVFESLTEMKADKVYFIKHILDDRNHSAYLDKIKKEIKSLKAIQIEEKVDIWDFYGCMEKFKKIILDEKKNGNKVWVNVSSGSKITAIAGMLACMTWGALPYYVRINYPQKQKMKDVEKEAVEKTIYPPVYGIEKPTDTSMEILRLIEQKGDIIRKVHLIKELVSKGKIKEKKGWSDVSAEPAKHSQLRTLLDPLIKHEFVEIKSQGPNSEVILTNRGKEALRFFG